MSMKNYEILSEVRAFPYLYNKKEKDYKKEDKKRRAWEAIRRKLLYEDGKTAQKDWANLKKLVSKRRQRYKEVAVSGAAGPPVTKARKALDEIAFVSWLQPFIQVRATKCNLPSNGMDEVDDAGDPIDNSQYSLAQYSDEEASYIETNAN